MVRLVYDPPPSPPYPDYGVRAQRFGLVNDPPPCPPPPPKPATSRADGSGFSIGVMGGADGEPELPLRRGAGGVFGVVATSGLSVVVNIIESPGNGGKHTQRIEDGVNIMDVFVEGAKASVARDIPPV